MRPHDAWLVDLDGTLYRARPVKLAMAAELILGGRQAIRVLRRFRREHEALRALDHDDQDPIATQVERTARAVGLERTEIERVVQDWMVERPLGWVRRFRRSALLDEIAAFHQSGGKTALVSDYPARRKLDALGASSLFDVIVACGEPGGPARLKPHPHGYLEAARRLGVSPERCLVIGDREDADGAAARAAGMAFRKV